MRTPPSRGCASWPAPYERAATLKRPPHDISRMTPKEFRDAALERVRRVVVQSDATFELLLAAFLVGGNVLIEGVPGTAKTLMARLLAQLLGSPSIQESPTDSLTVVTERFRRIQFTPDLMPSDIVGTNVFNSLTATFSLRRG